MLRDFRIFGYDFDPRTEQLIINEEEAAVVRQIFSWFLHPPPGMRGIAGIARALTAPRCPQSGGG